MEQTHFVPPVEPLPVRDAVLAAGNGHSDGVNSCMWSLDGRRLASASDDCTVRLWDGTTGKVLLTLYGHSAVVRSCAWSPCSRPTRRRRNCTCAYSTNFGPCEVVGHAGIWRVAIFEFPAIKKAKDWYMWVTKGW